VRIEAAKPNCCAKRRLLKLNGRLWGETVGHAFKEGAQIRLVERGRYRFVKHRGWKSRFDLIREADGAVLASVESGVFESTWRILLPSGGGAVLRPDGVFKSGFTLIDESAAPLARVDQRGACDDTIIAKPSAPVDALDLLIAVLVFDIVQHRRESRGATPN
jgi:hypothetical protein